jgi:hypothetical protein
MNRHDANGVAVGMLDLKSAACTSSNLSKLIIILHSRDNR